MHLRSNLHAPRDVSYHTFICWHRISRIRWQWWGSTWDTCCHIHSRSTITVTYTLWALWLKAFFINTKTKKWHWPLVARTFISGRHQKPRMNGNNELETMKQRCILHAIENWIHTIATSEPLSPCCSHSHLAASSGPALLMYKHWWCHQFSALLIPLLGELPQIYSFSKPRDGISKCVVLKFQVGVSFDVLARTPAVWHAPDTTLRHGQGRTLVRVQFWLKENNSKSKSTWLNLSVQSSPPFSVNV